MPTFCFFELSIGLATIPGKVIVELFDRQVPRVVENFRALCTGEKGSNLHYQGTEFHRVIETFTLQGGDTSGTGTGGSNIYTDSSDDFDGEDLYWRDIDEEMLLCMAEEVPRSQFFITLRPSPHLNGQHCCFGRVVRGQQILRRISEVDVDEADRPLSPVKIARCGELEYRGPAAVGQSTGRAVPVEAVTTETIKDDDRENDPTDRVIERKRRPRGSVSPERRTRYEHNSKASDEENDATRSSVRRKGSDYDKRRSSRRRHEHQRRDDHDRQEADRIRKQERIREFERYRRDPNEKRDIEYKGRGRMVYRAEGGNHNQYGRLS